VTIQSSWAESRNYEASGEVKRDDNTEVTEGGTQRAQRKKEGRERRREEKEGERLRRGAEVRREERRGETQEHSPFEAQGKQE
jgi:hypothetical protein